MRARKTLIDSSEPTLLYGQAGPRISSMASRMPTPTSFYAECLFGQAVTAFPPSGRSRLLDVVRPFYEPIASSTFLRPGR
jgi:hypothetical protein